MNFEEVYKRYYSDVFRFLYFKIRNYNDALDLTSEVFLRALKGFPRFEGRSSVKTWLFSIAMNVMRDYWKYRNRYLPLFPAPYADGTDDLENPLLSKEEVYEDEEDTLDFAVPLEDFSRAYHSLPQKFKEVLYLFYVEKMTYAEISETLGINTGTVKSRLSRAKKKLREILKKEGENGTR